MKNDCDYCGNKGFYYSKGWAISCRCTRMKLKVTPEGRKDMWIPEKVSLKAFIKSRKLQKIHNFIPSGMMMIGADCEVKSVYDDIDRASRMAVFTDSSANMGHSLALIFGDYDQGDTETLECFDIGKITKADLEIK